MDANKIGRGLIVFISLKTDWHNAAWADAFIKALRSMQDILRASQTSGEQDYLIRACVAVVAAYDQLCKKQTKRIDLEDVSASFVMEDIKETTALPIP